MRIISWLILILIVLLGTSGQLALKYALQSSTDAKKTNKSIGSLLFSLYFWIWFISYVVVTVLWLFVLRNLPLSQAFPALGLTFALVPLASYYFLREKVIFSQWLGIVMIVAGVVLVSQT